MNLQESQSELDYFRIYKSDTHWGCLVGRKVKRLRKPFHQPHELDHPGGNSHSISSSRDSTTALAAIHSKSWSIPFTVKWILILSWCVELSCQATLVSVGRARGVCLGPITHQSSVTQLLGSYSAKHDNPFSQLALIRWQKLSLTHRN